MQRDKIVQRENSDHTFFLFRRYDEDNSGGLSSEEVRKLFADYQLGVKLSDEEAGSKEERNCPFGFSLFGLDLVVKMLSKSGAKEISYADFKLFWSQGEEQYFFLNVLSNGLFVQMIDSRTCNGAKRKWIVFALLVTCMLDWTRTETV